MEIKRDERDDVSQTQSLGKSILSNLKANRGRLLSMFFIVYLIALVRVGSAGGWSSDLGFVWPSPGYQLFPIPINWHDFGFGSATVIVPMGIPDIVLYVLFVGAYVWIFWEALAVIYIFYPPLITKTKNRILDVLNRSP